LVPGGELFALIRSRKGLQVAEAAFAGACCLDALEYCHDCNVAFGAARNVCLLDARRGRTLKTCHCILSAPTRAEAYS